MKKILKILNSKKFKFLFPCFKFNILSSSLVWIKPKVKSFRTCKPIYKIDIQWNQEFLWWYKNSKVPIWEEAKDKRWNTYLWVPRLAILMCEK